MKIGGNSAALSQNVSLYSQNQKNQFNSNTLSVGNTQVAEKEESFKVSLSTESVEMMNKVKEAKTEKTADLQQQQEIQRQAKSELAASGNDGGSGLVNKKVDLFA